MRYLIHTFGCKSNQYETQAIRENLDKAGFSAVPDADAATVFIINTCGVTGRAVASCRNAIRKAIRGNPDLLVVITGCGVELGEPWPELPAEPLIVSNGRKHAIADLVMARLTGKMVNDAASDPFKLRISNFLGHTRAFLKIQDGCDNFCSYCAVPVARGKPRSRPREDILAEARRLVDAGYRELVLTGINIGVYLDGAIDFADVVSEIANTPGLERLRLGSVEPQQVDKALVLAMRDNDKICPHIHLPMQSGSDRVLSSMGRRYDADCFSEKVAMLKEYLILPAITTDVIVGFPGEEEDDYLDSCNLCEKAGFSRLHVFLFSARPGTAAAAMRSAVPQRAIAERKNNLIRLGEALSAKYASSCVGLAERVIIERGGAGFGDRYVKVRIAPPTAVGSMIRARIVSASGTDLVGSIMNFPDAACV